MEDRAYLCGWSLADGVYAVFVTARPAIRGEGQSLAEAQERFLDAIAEADGVFHASLEFDPPLPLSPAAQRYAEPALLLVSGDDQADLDRPRLVPFATAEEKSRRLAWHDQFFTAPVCRVCGWASSPRNVERALPVVAMGRGFEGAFAMVAGCMALLYSAAFLDLLTAAERARLEFRPVQRPGRAKPFFELVGPPGPPPVGVRGLAPNGWRCPACGRATWGYWIEGLELRDFVAKSDLPPGPPSVFTIGASPALQLCMTAERWRELVGRPGTKGVTSAPLGVVNDEDVIRRPELPARDAQ